MSAATPGEARLLLGVGVARKAEAWSWQDGIGSPTQLRPPPPASPPCSTVEHMFGNVFKCHSSGQVHVCDANCQQLVYNDRYSRMCRVSRRIFPAPPSEAPPACR